MMLMNQGIPAAHQLSAQSAFVDSGVALDMLSSQLNNTASSLDLDDDVFMMPQHTSTPGDHSHSSKASSEEKHVASSSSTDSSSSSNTTVVTSTMVTPNGLNRSKRTSFPKMEGSPDNGLKNFDDGEFFESCEISIDGKFNETFPWNLTRNLTKLFLGI